MTEHVQEFQPWSRVRWASTISLAIGIQLVVALTLSRRPATAQRLIKTTQVILPEHVAVELQELTDPTLFARGGPWHSSAPWLDTPPLPPVETDWEQPSQWLALDASALGRTFLELARAHGSSFHGTALKAAPKPSLTSPPASPKPLRTSSTLHATGDLVNRRLLNAPKQPSWPSKDVLLPSAVRVVVDAQGRVTSSILISGSGSRQADRLAVAQAQRIRFSPAPDPANARPLTLGELVFTWHTIPKTNAPQPAKSE